MAYEIAWSQRALADLESIVLYIKADNPARAESFGYELIAQTEKLTSFPELGRMVPEKRDRDLRELIYSPYRIVYRLLREQSLVEIVRVWPAARSTPQLD